MLPPRLLRARSGADAALLVLAVVGVVAGLVLRIVLARSHWGVLESDEAVVGLMARSITRGDVPTFYWGQQYGGTAEAFLVAVVGSVIGWSVVAIRVVAVTLSAVAALLLWRVGRRMIGPVAGATAGLAFWLWPLPYVFWSIKLRGFYWATIVCGLAFVLCAQRLAENPSRRRDAVVAGVAAGIGWWSSPQIVAFALPAAASLAWSHRHALRPLLTFGLPAAVVAAGPWLAVNLREGPVSLRPSGLAVGSGSYVEHLETFAAKGLPMALGLRLPFSEQWLPYGKPLYLLALVALGVAIVVRRPPILPVALVLFPFVHALSPLSNYVGEGRYLVYYAPFLALALASAATAGPRPSVLAGRSRATARDLPARTSRGVLPVLVVGLSLLTLHALDRDTFRPELSGGKPVPESFTPLVADLDLRGVRHVYADYWIGYRLTFETDERIIAAGPRNQSYNRRVAAADKVAYVFMDGTATNDSVRAELTRLGVAWQEHEVAGFRVIEPARTVTPETLWGTPP